MVRTKQTTIGPPAKHHSIMAFRWRADDGTRLLRDFPGEVGVRTTCPPHSEPPVPLWIRTLRSICIDILLGKSRMSHPKFNVIEKECISQE